MLPRDVKASLDRYVDEGCPTGGFLQAVLSNDLFTAVGAGDDVNVRNLRNICMYIYNYTPCNCWGSPKQVDDWLSLHRNEPGKAKRLASDDRVHRAEFKD